MTPVDDGADAPADFYTGLVAEMYSTLRSETFDPAPYVAFVERWGQPALELGCGDGDPLLDLCARGLDVEGLDSSADMLERARRAATSRGLDVTLHHAAFESMELGRRYRSIYLAGATFNLLVDDAAAQSSLRRIAAHLEPGGAAMIPLFVPQAPTGTGVGDVRTRVLDDGRTMTLRVGAIDRDEETRTQTTELRYELDDGTSVRVTDRQWILHWMDEPTFASMVDEAALSTVGVYDERGAPSTTHDTAFTFIVQPA